MQGSYLVVKYYSLHNVVTVFKPNTILLLTFEFVVRHILEWNIDV